MKFTWLLLRSPQSRRGPEEIDVEDGDAESESMLITFSKTTQFRAHSLWTDARNPPQSIETDLLNCILGNSYSSRSRKMARSSRPEYLWYLKYLENCTESLVPLLGPSYAQKSEKEASMQLFPQALQLIKAIVSDLSSLEIAGRIPSIDDIVTRLAKRSGSILEKAPDVKSKQKIVFAVIGWTSMLYKPRIRAGEDSFLRLDLRDATGRLLPTNIFHETSLSLEGPETTGLSLLATLALFGDIFPKPCLKSSRMRTSDLFHEQLVVSYLNFQTLYDIAEIRIVWVDCISLHLDFDEKKRKLKVFRFPSFCSLICHGMSDESEGLAPFLAP